MPHSLSKTRKMNKSVKDAFGKRKKAIYMAAYGQTRFKINLLA